MALAAFFVLNAMVLWILPLSNQAIQLFSILILLLFFGSLLVLFSSSFNDDALKRTDYQWISFPVKRSTAISSRFMVVFTLLILAAAVGFIWSLLLVPIQIQEMDEAFQRTGSHDLNILASNYRYDFWGFLFNMSLYFFFVRLFAFCGFVLMGIMTFTQSLRYAFRFNAFLRNLALLVLFISFCWFGLQGTDMGHTRMGIQAIMSSVIAGGLFLFLGIFLFEKYGEVS
jgi:hypothetical protein